MPNLLPLSAIPYFPPHVEPVCQQPSANTAGNGSVVCAAGPTDPLGLILQVGANALYNPRTDGWVTTPSITITGYHNGICWHPNGPTGTVSSATSLSITTNYTSRMDLAPYELWITGGLGAGQKRVVHYNTIGASTVFTVTEAWDTTPDATSTWVLRSGSFYFMTPTTGSLITMNAFDVATRTWGSALGVATMPPPEAANLSAICMAAPCCTTFSTGGVASATPTTLTAVGKAWGVNQWNNQQVRIATGTGAGQTRTITGNTADQLTVSVAWGTQPDTDSTFEIGGNEDHIYAITCASTDLNSIYRYTLSTDTWVKLVPTVARVSTSIGRGATLLLVDRETDPLWVDESNYQNGRWLYSFDGGGFNKLSKYDLVANTWWNDIVSTGGNKFDYVGRGQGFGPGGCSAAYMPGMIVLTTASNAGMFGFSPTKNLLVPIMRVPVTTAPVQLGNQGVCLLYTEGSTTIKFYYQMGFFPYRVQLQDI